MHALIEAGVNVNARTKYGHTALMISTRVKEMDVCLGLIEFLETYMPDAYATAAQGFASPGFGPGRWLRG